MLHEARDLNATDVAEAVGACACNRQLESTFRARNRRDATMLYRNAEGDAIPKKDEAEKL